MDQLISGGIWDILPSVAQKIQGLAGSPLAIPDAKKYILVLIDGFGDYGYRRHDLGITVNHQLLSTTIPSTTAAALSTLSTGVLPAQHGVVGYTFSMTSPPELVKPLNTKTIAPADLQLRTTIFEQLAKVGFTTAMVAPKEFRKSVFTQAVWAGANYYPVAHEWRVGEYLSAIAQALKSNDVVYVYFRGLDHEGHAHGPESEEAEIAWQWITEFLQQLRTSTAGSVPILVTGDHGMISVKERINLADEPELLRDVALFGGEGRFLHIYTEAPELVATRYQNRFGDIAEIRSGANTAEWFGEIPNQVANRIGSVVVALTNETTLLCVPERPGELGLKGAHGSITDLERLVPLLTISD